MSDECCARTRLECENECDEYVKQLKQQLEEAQKEITLRNEINTSLVAHFKEAVEVIEIAQKRIKKNPEHLVITQGDLINNKWHERARQFLAKYRGDK